MRSPPPLEAVQNAERFVRGMGQGFTTTAKSLLLAVVVRLAFDYGKCAVKLFGEYQTHHLVRKGHP